MKFFFDIVGQILIECAEAFVMPLCDSNYANAIFCTVKKLIQSHRSFCDAIVKPNYTKRNSPHFVKKKKKDTKPQNLSLISQNGLKL